MKHIHLATGIARRGGDVLLVASRYASHEQPLWNLPGGRQRFGELLSDTVVREVREETGYDAAVRGLAYVSESYDGATHFLHTAFEIDVAGTLRVPEDDHIVDAAWVPMHGVHERMAVAVAREPLRAYLAGLLGVRYAGFHEAGVTIRWFDD